MAEPKYRPKADTTPRHKLVKLLNEIADDHSDPDEKEEQEIIRRAARCIEIDGLLLKSLRKAKG